MESGVIVCDLDHTLSDAERREPFVPHDAMDEDHESPAWERYYAAQGDDPPIAASLRLLEALAFKGHAIDVLTGRPEKYRPETCEWLARHMVPYRYLFMRPTGDRRANHAFKYEMICSVYRPDEVFMVIDDNPVVLARLTGRVPRTLMAGKNAGWSLGEVLGV